MLLNKQKKIILELFFLGSFNYIPAPLLQGSKKKKVLFSMMQHGDVHTHECNFWTQIVWFQHA
jgi:hypothetical protein